MCKEPEVPRRDTPSHNKLFNPMMPLIFLRRSTLVTGTPQLKWHPMEDAIVNCTPSQMPKLLEQASHPIPSNCFKRNEGLLAYQVRSLTTAVFYKSIFSSMKYQPSEALKYLPL